MKRTGAYAHVFYDTYDASRNITGDGQRTTEPGQWYKIVSAAPGFGTVGHIPFDKGIFRAPLTGTQLTLYEGDVLFPINQSRICKTTCSVSMEEGTVDVSDDCDLGAFILDGNPQISGSLGKLFRYDNATEDFDEVTEEVLNKFVKTVKDDGAGTYEVSERENAQVELMINLNSNSKPGQTEHWLLMPAIISSASISLGNTDVQNQDMSFSKGEGDVVLYSAKRPVAV